MKQQEESSVLVLIGGSNGLFWDPEDGGKTRLRDISKPNQKIVLLKMTTLF
jgi:hypothetical protein